jgi:hypothetical protein
MTGSRFRRSVLRRNFPFPSTLKDFVGALGRTVVACGRRAAVSKAVHGEDGLSGEMRSGFGSIHLK